MIGATNRDPEALKHDLLARFVHRLTVPGLDERPEDLPLLARHLLRRLGRKDAGIRQRFFVGDEPRLAAELAVVMATRRFTTHVRELVELLWKAVADSPGAVLMAPPGTGGSPPPRQPADYAAPEGLRREQIVAALAAVGGVREQAWRVLGLRSRYQLKRLLKKYDIP